MGQPLPTCQAGGERARLLLSFVAILGAVGFVAAVTYVGYLFLLSLAGIPARYVVLVVTPLAVSVVSCLLLARLELKHWW